MKKEELKQILKNFRKDTELHVGDGADDCSGHSESGEDKEWAELEARLRGLLD